jgi:hypothetical protein
MKIKKTGTWDVEKNAAGDLFWVQKTILNKTGDIISNDPHGYHQNLETEKMIKNTLSQAERQLIQNSDQFSNLSPIVVGNKTNSSTTKSAHQQFEDNLWNHGSLGDYLGYKLNQLDSRYEGPEGLRNYLNDGFLVVSSAGQMMMFVPGAQGIGGTLMLVADFGETATDFAYEDFNTAVQNGLVRIMSYEAGVASDFFRIKNFNVLNSTETQRTLIKGTSELILENTEGLTIDYLNSQGGN